MEALTVQGGSHTVVIPESDLAWSASRASGPGGQNVNKVASKVELRFDMHGTQALSVAVKARLRALAGSALDTSGSIRIVSQVTRDQGRNLDDARDKLAALIAKALVVPKRRRATKPTRGSTERRLQAKREGSEKKAGRRSRNDD